MHEKAERARFLVDLGSHTTGNCETAWNLPQNWGHDSLCKSHNFLKPLRKRRFFDFYHVAPTVLDVHGFQEYKAATKSDFMVCCHEILHLQKGKDSADRECWWSLYLCAWETRNNWVFEWADALLVPGHEGKGAFTKEVSHNEHVQLFALECICKTSEFMYMTV